MDANHIVPGLKEAVVLAVNKSKWIPVYTLLEDTLADDSVEYRQLQQIFMTDNIIKEACSRGFTELVSVFLNSGVQANFIVDKLTWKTMLHLSAFFGHLSLVKLLLNVGADINCITCYGESPLRCAVEGGNPEVVKYIISAGANINRGYTLLHEAHLYRTVTEEMLQLLLDCGCDPNASYPNTSSPLYLAVRANKLNFVRMLLEAGARVNGMDKKIPLHKAVKHGIPVMQLLLDYGADINAKNHRGDTALHVAVQKGNLETVEFLIEHGSLISSVGFAQETPLSLSIENEKFDVTMLLINIVKPLDLDIYHKLLHTAVYRKAPVELIECLLEHGARVTTVYNKKTALEGLILYSHYSTDCKLHLAKLLLIYGSDHYVEYDQGNTLLHWACKMEDVELVEYLINYGLDVDAKNWLGKKPIDIAHEVGHVVIVNIIIEYHCNKYTSF